jgi:hypothetical protein
MEFGQTEGEVHFAGSDLHTSDACPRSVYDDTSIELSATVACDHLIWAAVFERAPETQKGARAPKEQN